MYIKYMVIWIFRMLTGTRYYHSAALHGYCLVPGTEPVEIKKTGYRYRYPESLVLTHPALMSHRCNVFRFKRLEVKLY